MSNHRPDSPKSLYTDPSTPRSTTRSIPSTIIYLVFLILFITGSVYAILAALDPMGTRSVAVVPADETYGAPNKIDDNARVVEYDGSFKLADYVKKNESVVLELKTDWCGYCKEFESRLGDIIERDARVRVVLIDVEKYEEFGKRFNVVGTPTFVRYESGKRSEVRVGSQSTEDFVNWVKE